MTDFTIINLARSIHLNHYIKSSNVSGQTKLSSKITKDWQVEASDHNCEPEVLVSEESNEKIDAVDFSNHSNSIAYELKVSGNNCSHEFYKDLCKILTFNLNNERQISTFVFISEHKGIVSLRKRLDNRFKKMIQDTHGLSIELFSLLKNDGNIAKLFLPEPTSWGFRGDPYLWEDLMNFFIGTPVPEKASDLKFMMEESITKLTNHSIQEEDKFFVEKYNHYGMSSGQVSSDFWNREAIPLILSRYEELKG